MAALTRTSSSLAVGEAGAGGLNLSRFILHALLELLLCITKTNTSTARELLSMKPFRVHRTVSHEKVGEAAGDMDLELPTVVQTLDMGQATATHLPLNAAVTVR